MLRLGESRPRCYGKRRLPGANGVPFPTVLPFSTLVLLRRTSRTVYATVAAITMRSCDQNNGVPSSNSSDPTPLYTTSKSNLNRTQLEKLNEFARLLYSYRKLSNFVIHLQQNFYSDFDEILTKHTLSINRRAMLEIWYSNLVIVTIKRRICDALKKIFNAKLKGEIMRIVVPIFFIFSCHA